MKFGGFWEGVEEGWPQAHPDGYGKLRLVRGTLEGSPLNDQFPIAKNVEKITGENEGQTIGLNAYATEGWCVSNRGWQATVTFATIGSHQLRLFDDNYKNEITQAKPGQTITIELKAALNQDWNKIDKGWVEICNGVNSIQKVEVIETDENSGTFFAKYTVPKIKKDASVKVFYGYLGFEKSVYLVVAK